jgi:hypothetical protein
VSRQPPVDEVEPGKLSLMRLVWAHELKHFDVEDYARSRLGSGAKISGSYADLMSEFSFRYLRY